MRLTYSVEDVQAMLAHDPAWAARAVVVLAQRHAATPTFGDDAHILLSFAEQVAAKVRHGLPYRAALSDAQRRVAYRELPKYAALVRATMAINARVAGRNAGKVHRIDPGTGLPVCKARVRAGLIKTADAVTCTHCLRKLAH